MKNILIFISGGVVLLAALFGWNYYEMNFRSAEVDQSFFSKKLMRDTVLSIESYKLIFGFYPASIEELRDGVIHFDPASGSKCFTDYYYALKENESTYYLFSKGKDCLAFTDDDIYPELTPKEKQNIGLEIPQENTMDQK